MTAPGLHGAALACLLVLAPSVTLATPAATAPSRTLQAFADEAEFLSFLATLDDGAAQSMVMPVAEPVPSPPPPPSPSPAAGQEESTTQLDSVVVTGSMVPQAMAATASPVTTITNVQTAGVDEGGIVKRQGDFLLVLRRGRLFSIRVGGDRLQPVDAIDAFAPGSDPEETWYDEMLVTDGAVVVIGYSYDRGGTEIGLFDLSEDGRLRHRDTYQMRGNDYYSARNYASRLIGTTLVIYTPLEISGRDADEFWPSLRRWRRGPTPPEFRRILPATRIYRTPSLADVDSDLALHTVSLCDLAAKVMECRSTAVLGPEGRTFYVSGDSVYVWTTPYDVGEGVTNASGVWRIPLDGSAPTGLRTSGSPIDQMSFLQADGRLHVVVGSEADGEGMWRSGSRAGELALLSVELTRFGDGTGAAAPGDYRALPVADPGHVEFQNRFLGEWLLVGLDPHDHKPKTRLPALLAMRYAIDAPVERVHASHDIERIDTLGELGAIAVGKHGPDLMFTPVRLDAHATPATPFVLANASQGEQRSHGYFYRADDADEGIAALPVLEDDGDDGQGSASVLYLRHRQLRLRHMGQLHSVDAPARDDDCQVSCFDWYGNARPIFLGNRVFALLGYELVEGTISDERIAERRRIDFSRALRHRKR